MEILSEDEKTYLLICDIHLHEHRKQKKVKSLMNDIRAEGIERCPPLSDDLKNFLTQNMYHDTTITRWYGSGYISTYHHSNQCLGFY